MKTLLCAIITSVLAFSYSAKAADTVLKIEKVHFCTPKDESAITKAVTKTGASVAFEDKPAANFPQKAFATVVITAKDEATAKKAAANIVEIGYWGKGCEVPPPASSAKQSSVTVTGAAILTLKNIKTFEYALKDLNVKHNAEPAAKEVKIDGNVSPKEVQDALLAYGFGFTIK
jgi:hypothetical protein